MAIIFSVFMVSEHGVCSPETMFSEYGVSVVSDTLLSEYALEYVGFPYH